MRVSATVKSALNLLDSSVQTNDIVKSLTLPVKVTGFGSDVNGGELLCLALATCFCNDIYREAGKRNMKVDSVEVTCSALFGTEGEAGSGFRYTAIVEAEASRAEIDALLAHTDRVAEIHNTLRKGAPVSLEQI